jgi:beta-galactosidase
MKKVFVPLLLMTLLLGCEKPEFQSRDILVTGTSEPVISLNGSWKFTMKPPENFFLNEVNTSSWNNIAVPGECAMQGFAIRQNKPYVYKKLIDIPSDYAGKTIKIRFEGVYSYARVWVNGKFIRDHNGGFTAWDCDITGIAEPGKSAWLTVEFTDKDNEISNASGFAGHPIGGILRSVSLLAIPVEVPEAIYITTKFDHKYRNSELTINIIRSSDEDSWIGFSMYDRNGKKVRLTDRRFRLYRDTTALTFRVRDPAKWSAEDPALYTLVTEVFNKSILTASLKTRFGFREVKTQGNKLLVNGQEVKLRGAFRHDIHPTLGWVSTAEYDLKDVLLAREANMNYIKTSYYPPSESFLRYCDEYGLYVENGSAVCLVNSNRNKLISETGQNSPEFLTQQFTQLKEIVMNHFNHPSVIIWSPGNDNLNRWGIKMESFSYADKPAIFDEWANAPCYNKPELQKDMNVRNFRGQSLDSIWMGLFASDGVAGGAIWSMIDETFMLPDTMSRNENWRGIEAENNGVKMNEGPVAGYGECGIVDTWRRRKPEFWNTKKAYSPVRILTDEITSFKAGTPLEIPVYNRFDHTNLKDVITEWTYRGKRAVDRIWTIGPHRKGTIQLRASDWTAGEMVNIRFLTRDSMLIDEYNIRLGKNERPALQADESNFTLDDTGSRLIKIESSGIHFTLNEKRGVIENVISGSDTIIRSGPWFNFWYPAGEHLSTATIEELKDKFIPLSVWYDQKGNEVNISVSGRCGSVRINYLITVKGGVSFNFSYSAEGLPGNKKVEEAGLMFITGNKFQNLEWEKNSYWNAYPAGHPGATNGSARLREYNRNFYRVAPGSEWALDNSSYYYNGLKQTDDLSYLASSMKENIYRYILSTSDKKSVTVVSDGDHACRLKKDGNSYRLYIDRYWDNMSIGRGNYSKNQTMPEKVTDSITIQVK